jgi:O-acetyl-ADP-ribose deacetylase (regulator of RNase III)
MNLIKTQGNLLTIFKEGGLDAIAHCCNGQGVMGSGIALSIKTDWPDAYEAYKLYEKFFGLTLGTVSDSSNVFNLHAQHLYGVKDGGDRFVDYEALYQCLEVVRTEMVEAGFKRLGVPYKMAADRAGGDWNVIEAMIVSVFKDTDIDVTVVEYNETRNA